MEVRDHDDRLSYLSPKGSSDGLTLITGGFYECLQETNILVANIPHHRDKIHALFNVTSYVVFTLIGCVDDRNHLQHKHYWAPIVMETEANTCFVFPWPLAERSVKGKGRSAKLCSTDSFRSALLVLLD